MTEIQSIFEVIQMILGGLLNFIQLIPAAFTYLTQVIAIMPIEIASFMLCVITASIVLLLLGRG